MEAEEEHIHVNGKHIKEVVKDDVRAMAKLMMEDNMEGAIKYLRDQGFTEAQIKAIKKEKAQEDKEARQVS